ncbi:hypothetical protein BJ085DRAFT_8887, partial [Dimargaris cristalligena]
LPAPPADNCSKDASINSQDKLNQIAGCKDFSGSITIDGASVGTINLGNMESISGDLTIQNIGSLTSIDLPKLESVGKLTISNNTALSALNLNDLEKINSFVVSGNPSLSALAVPKGFDSMDTFRLLDSSLKQLPLFNFTTVTNFELYGNRNLNNITLANLGQVKGFLSVVNNSPSAVLNLPQLTNVAQNCTFANLKELNAESLKKVQSNLNVQDNYFSDFSLDKLTDVSSSVSVINNADLESFTFKNLAAIGGNLLVVNNTKIGALDGFPALETVEGTIDVRGSFKNVTFDSLDKVKGSFTIKSTEAISCDKLKSAYG